MAIFGDDGSAERRAHEIAREIVANELQSIDRMHTRTLTYITWYASVMVVIFGLLGFIGFQRLQGIVLRATVEKVREQTFQRVNEQVDKDLNNMNLPSIVSGKVAAFASSDLRGALIEQVQRGPVNDLIRSTALAAAAGARTPAFRSSAAIDAKANARSFTGEQQTQFQDCIAHRQSLPPLPTANQPESASTAISRYVNVFVVPGDTEALNLANQVKDLVSRVGWQANVAPDSFVATIEDQRFAVGVHFANNFDYGPNAFSRRSNEAVGSIFACLGQAGLKGQPTNVPESMRRSNGSFITIGAQH